MIRCLGTGIRARATNLLRHRNPSEIELVRKIVKAETPGVMVDVGAHYGESLRWFVDNGWVVHAFEPDPATRKRLETSVGGRPNLYIDERAVSDRAAWGVTLYRSPVSSGISGLSAFHHSHRAVATVDVTTLADYLHTHGIERIDVLKIDAEGFDLHVLRGLDWKRAIPRFVVCEFEDAKTRPLGYHHHDVAEFLRSRGYLVMVSEWVPIVRYGGTHRWRRFETYPMKLADPAGWGNFIAAVPGPDWAALTRACRRTQAFLRLLNDPIKWLESRRTKSER